MHLPWSFRHANSQATRQVLHPAVFRAIITTSSFVLSFGTLRSFNTFKRCLRVGWRCHCTW